ncbi:MAG: hypothetical protein U0183_22820 [Polyangiaceae bacterium]
MTCLVLRGLVMASLLGATTGCGAMFHASQIVTIEVPNEAQVYRSGMRVIPTNGKISARVVLNQSDGEYVVLAKGAHARRVVLEREVDAAAIVCDVLWSLTILGVAAPLSDAVLGTFVKAKGHVPVPALEPFPEVDNVLPVHSVATEEALPDAHAAAQAPVEAGPEHVPPPPAKRAPRKDATRGRAQTPRTQAER